MKEASAPALTYLEQAEADAAALTANATAENTRIAYASDIRDFTAWCSEFGLDPLPATPETVRAYLASLVKEGLRSSTIRRRKAAIAASHRQAGLEPPTNSEAVKALASGISRKLGTNPSQKAPITADVLAKVIPAIDPSTKRGLRDRALLLIGFAGAFRRSELVGIDLEHIARHREGVQIMLGRTKTDQHGRGHLVPIPKGQQLRPVAALDAWIQAAEISTGPIFRSIDKADQVRATRLTGRDVARIVKARLAEAGFDPEEYSGHSLRSGYVTSAMDAGTDIFAAANHGRWRRLETMREYDRRNKVNWKGHSFL